MPEKTRKITLIGNRSVGKSSMVSQYVLKRFPDTYNPTVDNTFHKSVVFHNQEYELELHDTAGQDSLPLYGAIDFINVDAWIFVYSITSFTSFEFLARARSYVEEQTGGRNVPLVLVGNKSDLSHSRRVPKEEAQNLASKWNVPFLEVSAKENKCVDDVFERVLMEIEQPGSGMNPGGGGSRCVVC